MDILFYDWLYLGVYLPTPMTPTDIHSHVMGIIFPQSTFVIPEGLEPSTPSLKVRCSSQLSYEIIVTKLVFVILNMISLVRQFLV